MVLVSFYTFNIAAELSNSENIFFVNRNYPHLPIMYSLIMILTLGYYKLTEVHVKAVINLFLNRMQTIIFYN
jgi:hypothetical protein